MTNKKDPSLTRRRFLAASGSLVAAGVAGLTPTLAVAQTSDAADRKRSLIYRTLGRTGIRLPIVSMGVMNAANTPSILPAAYEAGIRHFDTASLYQYGRNEQMVGKVVAQLGVRDRVTIATKIYHRTTRGGQHDHRSRQRAQRAIRGQSPPSKDGLCRYFVHSQRTGAGCGPERGHNGRP
jgi:hypothetical protein